MIKPRHRRLVFPVAGLFFAMALVVSAQAQNKLSYGDVVRRTYDLELLAFPPDSAERTASSTSYDRRSRYNPATQRYENWGANRDGNGHIRPEGSGIVAFEADGPGVIWRSWSAAPGSGHIQIYIDGAETPALDIPFQDFFNNKSPRFAFPHLVHSQVGGHNNFVPISYQKSCKIVLQEGWGQFYQFTATSFPDTTKLPSFTGTFNATDKAALLRANQRFGARGSDPKTAHPEEQLSEFTVTIPPGKTSEFLRLNGAGSISQIHVTPVNIGETPERALRELALSLSWDNEKSPSVWAPLGDYFASAPGIAPYQSLPCGFANGTFYSYWFMPFSDGATLKIINDGPGTRTLTLRVLHRSMERAETDSLLRFHAKWHRDDYRGLDRTRFELGDRWPDWPLLSTEGSGRFCGTALHAWNPNSQGRKNPAFNLDPAKYPFRIYDTIKQAALRGFWGEGDEKFFVDGEVMPSSFGTGSANYFGHSWLNRSSAPFQSALQNQPVNKDNNLGHVSNNRFHIADNIPFNSSFAGFIGKVHPNEWPLLYAATVYWYQKRGESDPYVAVSGSSRTDYFSSPGPKVKAPADGQYEGEDFFVNKANARKQDMRSFQGKWSKGAHLLWHGKKGDSTSVRIPVAESRPYQLKAWLTRAPDYGKIQLLLNNKPIGSETDLYSAKVDRIEVDLGEHELPEGNNELSIKLTGSNPNAHPFRTQFYLIGLDKVVLIPRPIKQATIQVAATTAPPKGAEPDETLRTSGTVSFSEAREIMSEHCFRCHGDKEKVKGKVHLKRMTSKQHFLDDIDLTRSIIDALEAHEMPPEEEEQPDINSRGKLINLLQGVVAEYLDTTTDFEPIVMRRLNRYEFSNATRDLLGLKGDIYPLPEKVIRPSRPYYNPASGRFPDAVEVGNRPLGKFQVEQQILEGVVPFAIDLQSEHGFNNRGDELSLPPILLESFLQLGQSIVNSPQFNGYCNDYAAFFEPGDAQPESYSGLVRQRLAPFLERAFRSKVDQLTLDRYVRFFEQEFKNTESFSGAMKKIVSAVLASPRFIYLVEQGKAADARISDYELATRLSFYLWSTIPDPPLLALARKGELSNPQTLRLQVQRMLKDPRSQALSQNFARQWLRLDQLITAVPDMERFPIYYSRIGCEQWKFGLQTMIEPLLLFESILVEDRSILLLIDSDYAYRSDELQSWYRPGTPFNRKGNVNRFNTNRQKYTRRNLATRREGGVIASAATLTMTSSPLRTSPIVRGSWIATVVFNDPPPPPPDTVPEIEADDAAIEAQGLTLRQRLKEHQENESCASCHSKIDPLGFALENFDAIGRWRDKYRSGLKIDASGKLFGQTEFNDVVSFKDAVLTHSDKFMTAFTEHLLTYALGRKLTVADEPAVNRISRRLQEDGGRISTVISEIATSSPFMK